MCATDSRRRASPLPEQPITRCREYFPSTREPLVLRVRRGHSQSIETTVPSFRIRHASTMAAVLLVLSVVAAVGMLWVDRTGARAGRLVNDPLTTVSELLCCGVV